jgi:hypothetical protein
MRSKKIDFTFLKIMVINGVFTRITHHPLFFAPHMNEERKENDINFADNFCILKIGKEAMVEPNQAAARYNAARSIRERCTDDIELFTRSQVRKGNHINLASQFKMTEIPRPAPYFKRVEPAFDNEPRDISCGLAAFLFPATSKLRAVVALQHPHCFLSASDPFFERLGYTHQELIGRSLKLLSGPNTDTSALHAAIKRAVHLNFECIEATVYTRAGAAHHALVSCFPFIDSAGVLLGCTLELALAPRPPQPAPLAPRVGAAAAARRRAHNYRTGLALHAEHCAPAGPARAREDDAILARLLASL